MAPVAEAEGDKPERRTESGAKPSLRSMLIGDRRRRITTGCLAVAGLLLAWLIVTSVETSPSAENALAADGSPATTDPNALIAAAAAEVGKGAEETDWERVQVAARTALESDPLAETALGYYGLGLARQDRPDQALTAMTMAADRSLRDPIAHSWLYDHFLQAGELDRAIAHADVVIRAHPELRYTFYDSMRQLTAAPQGVQALVNALKTDPPWRAGFLQRTLYQPPSLAGPTALFAELQETSSPPRNHEIAPLLTDLVEAGRFQDALLIWLKVLPKDQFASLDYLSNGDFRFPLSGLPFDWTITPIAGAETAIESTVGGEDALHVQFYRGRVPFRNVSKLLVLPPGRYVLRGRERADELETERGMAWKIVCAGPGAEPLAATEPLKGRSGWEDFETSFTVPPSGCPAQWLRLELDARSALDRDVGGGSVWYDDLAISRAPAEPKT